MISQGKIVAESLPMKKLDSGLPATPTVQVIERMFTLLEILAQREEAMSLKEISEKSGLHPSTAHRILNDLATGRFVDRPVAGNYRLGMRLLELGNLVKARLNVRDAALVPMRELHKLTQQPVNLSMRQGDEIIYVERAYSERSGMQVVRAIGGRGTAAFDICWQAFFGVRRSAAPEGVRHAYWLAWSDAQQHHTIAGT